MCDRTLLLEVDFSAENSRKRFDCNGEISHSGNGALITTKKGAWGTIMSREFMLDGDSESLFIAEWSFTPKAVGGYTSDFALDCGIFSVDLIADAAPYLNYFFRARGAEPGRTACELKIDVKVEMRCEFNRLGVFSWTVNGEKQLLEPIAAKDNASADSSRIIIGHRDDLSPEYSPIKNDEGRTVWHYVRVYRDSAEKARRIKLLGFDLGKRQEKAGFMVGACSPMTQISAAASQFQGEIASVIKLSGAGREIVSQQLAIIPINKSLEQVSLELSSLFSTENNEEIPAKNINWFQVGYVKVDNNRLDNSEFGHYYPDILISAKKFAVRSDIAQPVWLDIKIPEGTSPGKYSGIITVNSSNAGSRQLKVELQVRAFTLPLRSRLPNAFAVNPGLLERCYAPEKSRMIYGEDTDENFDKMYNLMGDAPFMDKEFWKNYCDFILSYRLNPVSIYSDIMQEGKCWVIPDKELLEYCYKKGMNALCLLCIRDIPRDGDAQQAYLGELRRHLDSWKQIADSLNFENFTWFVHAFDESELATDKKEYYDYAIELVTSIIKNEFPWVKTETANSFIERHADRFDIWTPRTFELPSPEQRNGKHFWTYVCCGPNRPYANFFMDYDGICSRILPWQIFKEKTEGFLYYLINREITAADWSQDHDVPFPFIPIQTDYLYTNGDGLLMYPGPEGELFASVRLANLRNGLQDYESWSMLQDRIEDARNLSVDFDQWRYEAELLMRSLELEITPSFINYTRDPEVLERARARVQCLIEQFEEIKRG